MNSCRRWPGRRASTRLSRLWGIDFCPRRWSLIAEEFFERVARGLFAAVRFRFGGPNAPGHFEPFAVIAQVLVENGFGAAIAALLGRARIVGGAIEANAQVRAAFVATLA